MRIQTFDSSGPEVRIRGNAWQVHERYLNLARDAAAAGDRVAAENFFQHADHYYRLINVNGEGRHPQGPQPQQGQPMPPGAPQPGPNGAPGPDMPDPNGPDRQGHGPHGMHPTAGPANGTEQPDRESDGFEQPARPVTIGD